MKSNERLTVSQEKGRLHWSQQDISLLLLILHIDSSLRLLSISLHTLICFSFCYPYLWNHVIARLIFLVYTSFRIFFFCRWIINLSFLHVRKDFGISMYGLKRNTVKKINAPDYLLLMFNGWMLSGQVSYTRKKSKKKIITSM